MRKLFIGGVVVVAALAQGQMSFIKMSPILNSADTNQDGVVSAEEIANAPAQLRKLDKNGDGKLTREEAGLQLPVGGGRGRGGEGRGGGGDEPPAPAPSAMFELPVVIELPVLVPTNVFVPPVVFD